MDLKEFVRDTLVQIVEGVKAAQADVAASGADINARTAGQMRRETNYGAEIQDVNFDVAVTTESMSGGGAKVAVWGIGAGLEGSSKDSVASRIKFSIPIALPRATPTR